MKILMITPYLVASGGAERAALQDAEMLRQHGHDVVFLAFDHPEGLPQAYAIPANGVTDKNYVSRQGLATKGRLLLQLFHNHQAVSQLNRAIEAEKPDVIHLHRVKAFSPALFPVLRQAKIPVVMTLHDHYLTCPSSTRVFGDGAPCTLDRCQAGTALRKKCVSNSLPNTAVAIAEFGYRRNIIQDLEIVSSYIVPSNFLRNWSIRAGIPAGKLVYLPNATEVLPTEGYSPSCFTYVGRLSPEKGLETFMQAASMLPQVSFQIVGDGPSMGELRETAATRGIHNVHFTGALQGKNLVEAFKKSHALILPSTCFENAPLVILEAFAHRIPVIGSHRGGIPELIIEGETGFTFEPGNSTDLASKVERMLKDPKRAEQMGLTGHARVVAEFSPEVRYEKLLSIYHSALGGSNG